MNDVCNLQWNILYDVRFSWWLQFMLWSYGLQQCIVSWMVPSHLENTAESTSEMLLSTYQTPQSYNPEDHNLINLKPLLHITNFFLQTA
jgi:hypothetical protein